MGLCVYILVIAFSFGIYAVYGFYVPQGRRNTETYILPLYLVFIYIYLRQDYNQSLFVHDLFMGRLFRSYAHAISHKGYTLYGFIKFNFTQSGNIYLHTPWSVFVSNTGLWN